MSVNYFPTGIKTIAIVGLSDNPDRPSFEVGAYFKSKGFRIIPVNPTVTQVLGEKSYPNLLEIPKEIHIDIIDIFRRSENVSVIVKEAVMRGDAKIIWMQEGITNLEAQKYAHTFGLEVVSNFCLMKAHKKFA